MHSPPSRGANEEGEPQNLDQFPRKFLPERLCITLTPFSSLSQLRIDEMAANGHATSAEAATLDAMTSKDYYSDS